MVVTVAACLLVPFAGSAAGPPDVVCPQDTFTFTGTAHDLIVPEGGFCAVTDATITHDMIQRDNAGAEIVGTSIANDLTFGDFSGADISKSTVGHDIVAGGTDSGAGITDSSIGHDFVGRGEESGADILRSTIGHDMQLLGLGGGTHLESVTIGHDLVASKPQTVQTGHNSPNTPGGPVRVGHDFVIEGSPGFPFVFDGLCNLTVGRDLRITDRTVNLGMGNRQQLPGQRPAAGHDRPRSGCDGQPCGVRLLRAVVDPGRGQPRRPRSRVQQQHRSPGWWPGGLQKRRRPRRDLCSEQPGRHSQRA